MLAVCCAVRYTSAHSRRGTPSTVFRQHGFCPLLTPRRTRATPHQQQHSRTAAHSSLSSRQLTWPATTALPRGLGTPHRTAVSMEQQLTTPSNTLPPLSPLLLSPLPSPAMSPLPSSPPAMPSLPSAAFEPSPFTLPSSSAPNAARRSSRRKRGSTEPDTTAEGEEEAERKRRRQEQNRRAAATSRVNNRQKRSRLEEQLSQLEQTNERLKRQRQTLLDNNSSLASSASPHTPAPHSPAASSSSPPPRVGRSSNRESAVLVPLPWVHCLQLTRNKPHIRRALVTMTTLVTLLTLCTATILLVMSCLTLQSTSPTSRSNFRPALPPSPPPTLFSFSPLPPLLLLSSLLSLSAAQPRLFSPSLSLPTLRPTSPSSPLLASPLPPTTLRVGSLRRRLTLFRPSASATLTAPPAGHTQAGISGAALAGVRLRAGRSVGERVWTRGGVRFQTQVRGTNASVSANDRAGSPPWLLAVLMVTAMVS